MQSQFGYYGVTIEKEGKIFVHTIAAKSDFDAALQIRRLTGCMPKNENDVLFLYTENITMGIPLPWLHKNTAFGNKNICPKP